MSNGTANQRQQHRPRIAVTAEDRRNVLASEMCHYCSDRVGPFEVEHMIPASRGGTSERPNLACACVSCNTQKKTMKLHEWIQWRTSNGMCWPPVASHPTDPVHFQTSCTTCRLAGSLADFRRHTYPPLEMTFIAGASRGADKFELRYACRQGHTWRAWQVVTRDFYTDCPCAFCDSRRLESAAPVWA